MLLPPDREVNHMSQLMLLIYFLSLSLSLIPRPFLYHFVAGCSQQWRDIRDVYE